MKRLLLISLMGILLTGCTGSEDVNIYGSIYGTVRNAVTGEPVYNAEITLSPSNRTTVSGTDGSYEYQNLDPQQYSLSVTAKGYQYNNRTVTVIAGENTLCDMLLSPASQISGVEVSTNTLNFDAQYTDLSLDIRNTGTSGTIDWTITNIDVAWLTVSPMNGSTEMGKSSSIKVSVDRSAITDDTWTIFQINAAGGSYSIMVAVRPGNSGSGGNDNNGDGGGSGNGGSDSGDVTSGLYGYYTFEENLKNMVDGAPNATGVNNPTYVDGMNGTKGLRMKISEDGKYSYFSIPEGMINDGSFTVSFWISGISDGHIFHTEGDGRFNGMRVRQGFIEYGCVPYWGYGTTRFDNASFDHSAWYHIVLTSNKTSDRDVEVKLYVNGEYTDIQTEGFATKQRKFVFGGEYDGVTPPNMMTIDNLRIYSTRALSDKEVEKLYNYEK